MSQSIGILIDKLKNNDLCVAASLCCLELLNLGTNAHILYNSYGQSPLWINGQNSFTQMSEVYRLKGVAIATCENTCSILKRLNTNILKYFYVWDLDYIGKYDYNRYINLYRGPYNILTRSKSHSDILRKVWGVKSRQISEFNPQEINSLCNMTN